MSGGVSPVYRVETKRLVLRCWNPADAPLLKIAVDDSADHLRPWMPWVTDEPEPLNTIVERLRRFRGQFDFGADFIYGAFSPDETEVWGGTGLHPRVGEGGLEIGYWIHVDRVNRGFATELSAALTRVAIEHHGVRRVHIMCEPGNAASRAVPKKLGYEHEATLRERCLQPNDAARDSEVWTMFRRAYAGSPSAAADIHAFDAAGEPVDLRFRERGE